MASTSTAEAGQNRTISQPGESALEKLPLELMQTIMKCLPAASIPSLILTSKAISRAFYGEDKGKLLINQMIDEEINPELRVWAVIVFRSSGKLGAKKFSTMEEWRDLLEKNRKEDLVVDSLEQAVAMSKFHGHVQTLTQDFIASALEKRPATWPATTREIVRIQRAFYIYETHWNVSYQELAGQEWTGYEFVGPSEPINSLRPEEKAQLVCVHDYLDNRQRPLMEAFREHDIEWSIENRACYQGYLLDIGCRLSLGLERLSVLATKMEWEQIRSLMTCETPREEHCLIMAIIRPYLDDGIHHYGLRLKELSIEDQTKYTCRPSCESPQPGPETTWRKLHANSFLETLHYSCARSFKSLRQWGYVFWDQDRIDKWGDMDELFQDIWDSYYRPYIKEEDTTSATFGIFSLKRKAELYAAGGRGYWDPLDERDVQWPEGPSPSDTEADRAKCEACLSHKEDSSNPYDSCVPHRIWLAVPGVRRTLDTSEEDGPKNSSEEPKISSEEDGPKISSEEDGPEIPSDYQGTIHTDCNCYPKKDPEFSVQGFVRQIWAPFASLFGK